VASGCRLDPLQHGVDGGFDLEPDVGAHDRAAVGDRCVRDRELQRRDLHVAVSDGEVDVVAAPDQAFDQNP